VRWTAGNLEGAGVLRSRKPLPTDDEESFVLENQMVIEMSDKPSALRALFTKELIALMLIAGSGTLAQELLSPVLSLYMREIGFSDQNIGLAFTVMMIGIMFSELFWGWAVDRTNLKVVLAVGTFAYGGMTFVLLTTHTFAMFLPIILVYGFSRSPLYVVNRWYMGAGLCHRQSGVLDSIQHRWVRFGLRCGGAGLSQYDYRLRLHSVDGGSVAGPFRPLAALQEPEEGTSCERR